MRDVCEQIEIEISRFIPSPVMKTYWIDGAMKKLEEALEGYRQARRRKRDQMWFLYIDLREDFDEIERDRSGLDFPFENSY